MSSLPFLDIAFPRFAPTNWKNGISIFRSDGVSKIIVFSELVEAIVNSGIGENYTVRVKLHKLGKGIQWMECSCAAHRRRNEMCSHIAALCIHLDQQRPDILEKMNLEGQIGEKFFNLVPVFQNAESQHVENVTETEKGHESGAQKSSITQNKSSIDITKIENVALSKSGSVLSVEFKHTRKKFVLEFKVDDAIKILQSPNLPEKVKHISTELICHEKVFKFCFLIKELQDKSIEIEKCLKLFNPKNELEYETLPLQYINEECIGTHYFLHGKFIPIHYPVDKETKDKWNSYPKKGILKGDIAAILVESGFERLSSTAELIFDANWSFPKVFSKITLKDISYERDDVGNFILNPDINLDNDFEPLQNQQPSVLKDILMARMEGRQYVKTQKGWLKIDDQLDWLKSNLSKDGKIKFSTLEFIKFQKLISSENDEPENNDLSIFERIKTGIKGLNTIPTPEINPFGNFHLRPYQEEGRQWLWWLYCNSLGGILADEMGLGKTHQAMGLMACIAATEKQPLVLVVCPTSVIDHWYDKVSSFLTNVEVIPFHGSQRKRIFFSRSHHLTVVITSYGVLLRDINLIEKNNWNLVVLDEAHLVKNQRTRTYAAACRIKSKMRLCLTGTPLENDIMELKNLFDFIAPTYLSTDSDFKKRFLQEKDDALADTELKKLIHPFQLRRKKNDVLKDLPEKVEDVKHCFLNKEQYKLYKEALALKGSSVVEQLQNGDGKPVSYIHVFSIITLLKQICNDPGLIDPKFENAGSGKILLFQEILQEALESGHKVVVFSQYARMVERLSKKLTSWGVEHVSLTGQTTKRGKVIEKFQNDENVKVFIGSLLAGGTGIDLTSANVVIHFDRWWNSAKEDQATDRIHRIGQLKNVQVYKLVTRGTVESRIDEIISRKKKVFERFVEFDQDLFKNLSRQDLLELLAEPSETVHW